MPEPKIDVFEQIGQAYINANAATGVPRDSKGRAIPAAALGLKIVQEHPDVITQHPTVVAAISNMPEGERARVHNVLKASMILQRDKPGLMSQVATSAPGQFAAGAGQSVRDNLSQLATPGGLAAMGGVGAINAAQAIPGSQPVTVPLAWLVNMGLAGAAGVHAVKSGVGAVSNASKGNWYESGASTGQGLQDVLAAAGAAKGAKGSRGMVGGIVDKVKAAMEGIPQKAQEAVGAITPNVPTEMQGVLSKLFGSRFSSPTVEVAPTTPVPSSLTPKIWNGAGAPLGPTTPIPSTYNPTREEWLAQQLVQSTPQTFEAPYGMTFLKNPPNRNQ